MRSCIWPDCDKVMPIIRGGCRQHLKQIPKPLRRRFLHASEPEHLDKLPAAERAVLQWIEQQRATT